MLRGIRSTRLALACAAVISVLGVTACSSDQPSSGTPTPAVPIASCISPDEQRDHGVTAKRPDGFAVDGLIYGTGKKAIVLANQVDTDLCGWQPYNEIFAQKGYQVFVFNYTYRVPAQDDILAGVSALRERGATNVFLIGASKGGTLSLAAAAVAQPPVSGVVSLSGPMAFEGTNAFELMGKLTVPAIFAAGDYDKPFADNERALYEAAASTDKQLVILPNPRHGVGLLDQATLALIEEFLSKHSAA